MSTTKAEVFIIESLDLDDEDCGRPEGRRIADMLKMSDKECKYFYIRTKQELLKILEVFKESDFRYLHLSSHGLVSEDDERFCGLSTTFDQINTEEVGTILRPYINDRRVFISACKAGSWRLARVLMRDTTCHSVMAPTESVSFGDMAICWAAFYHAMFKLDKQKMSNKRIEETGKAVAKLFQIELKLFSREDDGSTFGRNLLTSK